MIKKLLYINLMFIILVFSVILKPLKVLALPPTHEHQIIAMDNWSNSHLYEDVYMFYSGLYEIQPDTTHLEIFLPNPNTLVQIYKGVESIIKLYDTNNTLIDTIPITDSLTDTSVGGTHKYTLYESSLHLVGMWGYFEINIVHKGLPQSSITVSLNDNSTYRTFRESYAHIGNINWYNIHFYDNYYGITTNITLIDGWSTIDIILPISSLHIATIGNVNASVSLLDDNNNVLWSDDLALNGVLYGFRGDTPIIKIDRTNELMDIPDLEYTNLVIVIPQLVSSPLNSSYLISLNERTEMFYNGNVSYYVAIVKGNVVEVGRFNDYFYAPSAAYVSIYLNNNERLSHWIDINGNTVATVRYTANNEEYNMYIKPSPEMFINKEETYIHIYAVLENVYIPPPIDIIPPNVNIPTPIYNIFNTLGLNNDIGYFIIYTIIVLILAITLVFIKIPILAIIIILIIITGYFTYLGMFSVPIIFVLFFVYISLFIINLRGGLK